MNAASLPRRFGQVERVSRRVVLATDQLTGRSVALKIAGPEAAALRELVGEANLLTSFAHPGIPRFVEFGFLADGRAFLAMERAAGERPTGPMDVPELAAFADGCCEALGQLHARGLLHRDLKPDNVRFDAATGRVVLLDLGLVAPVGRAPDCKGTRGFMAPEALERGEIDVRADLYALGGMLYEAAAGRPAFTGESAAILRDQRAGRFVPLGRLRRDLPGAFVAEVERLLDADPQRRPGSVLEARQALAASLGAALRDRFLAPEVVGRRRAGDALALRVEAARHRPMRVVILGRDGSGRTRLLESLRCRLALDRVPMLLRRADVPGLHPLANLLDDLALLLDIDPGVPEDVRGFESGLALVERAAAALARAGAALPPARRPPLVLAFDDCSRAHPSVRADLEAFSRRIEGHVLLVMACDDVTGPMAEGADVIELEELSDVEAVELASSALQGDVPAPVREAVLAGSREPGAVLEALELAGCGLVESATAPRAEASAPASDHACRVGAALLALAAPVRLDLLAAVAGLASAEADEALDELVRRGSAWNLDGAILAGPSLVLCPAMRRGAGERALHDRILERWSDVELGLPSGESAVRRRGHVAASSDPLAATLAHAAMAVDALRGGHASEAREAVQLGLDRSIEAPPGTERCRAEALLMAAAGSLAERNGQLDDAIALRERSIERARDSGDRSLLTEAFVGLARLRIGSGDDAAARDTLLALLDGDDGAEAEPADDSRNAVLAELAGIALREGHLDDCERWIDKASDAAAPSRCRGTLALVRARLLAARGDAGAAPAYEAAVEALEQDAAHAELAPALSELGAARLRAGDMQGAFEAWTDALAAAEGVGDVRSVAAARDLLADLNASAGRPGDAAQHARRAARAWARVGREEARVASALVAGRHALGAGAIQAAAADLQAARRAMPVGADPELRAGVLIQLGLAKSAAAEQAEALACCEEALSIATEAGDLAMQARAATSLGRIFGDFGSTRDGVRWQRRALDLAAGAHGIEACLARVELASLLVREGHLQAAESALVQALAEADAAQDVRAVALVRLRLGRVLQFLGELGAAERQLHDGIAQAASRGDRLVELEGMRLLGGLECEIGEHESGLSRLEAALAGSLDAGWYAGLPAAHEALGHAHLRRALRLRTPTGVVVDRQDVAIARAHLEKGLDLTVATGRMADRAALLVLDACALEMIGDAREALVRVDEGHRLALDTGDLLVASRARLVKGDALLALREFGVALAEARIACEAIARSGSAGDEWRAHALLARVQGAWGMPRREAASTNAAEEILRRLAASLGSSARARVLLADAERQAASTPGSADSVRARRSAPTEILTERLGGRVDTEDLVEALIAARRQADDRGFELRTMSERHRRCDGRRRLLARISRAAARGRVGDPELSRVLGGIARAWGADGVLLASVDGATIRVHATAGSVPEDDETIAVLRRVTASGEREAPHATSRRRRALRVGVGDCDVAVPLRWHDVVVGALLLKLPPTAPPRRRADLALLDALAPMLAGMLAAEPVRDEVRASLDEPVGSRA